MRREECKELSYQAVLLAYIEECQNYQICPDNIYLVKDVDYISDDDAFFMVNFIQVLVSLEDLFHDNHSMVEQYLNTPHPDMPMCGMTPLEFMKIDPKHILEVLLYLNALGALDVQTAYEQSLLKEDK